MDKKSKRQSNISKYANIKTDLTWQITYFNDRIRRIVWQLPAGILADYLRLTDAMALYGADLRMPHSRSMGSGLFELRPKGPEGIARVFYCLQIGKTIVVLHSFIKKTQETPPKEIRLAKERAREVRNG